MGGWLVRIYRDAAAGRIPALRSGPARRALAVVQFLVVLVREVVRDRLHVRAATLAFWSAVATVPILVVGFALAAPLGVSASAVAAVKELLYDTVLAASVEEVGGALDRFLAAANLRALGVVGLLSLLLVGAQLYFQVELAYNDVFRSRVRRPWLLRFTLFYAAITLGPLALASGALLGDRLPAGLAPGRALPFLLSAAVLVAAIRLLPCTRVRWRSATAGGLLSAVLFEATKAGFGLYTELFGTRDSLAIVYGSLALVPVFLVWMYVLWLVVLVGVEFARVLEHRRPLLEAEREAALLGGARRREPDAFLAVAALAALAAAFEEGAGPQEAEAVALRMGRGVAPRDALRALEVLRDAGLVAETDGGAFLPARPPAELRPSEVLLAWRERAAAPGGPVAEEAARVAGTALDASGPAWPAASGAAAGGSPWSTASRG